MPKRTASMATEHDDRRLESARLETLATELSRQRARADDFAQRFSDAYRQNKALLAEAARVGVQALAHHRVAPPSCTQNFVGIPRLPQEHSGEGARKRVCSVSRPQPSDDIGTDIVALSWYIRFIQAARNLAGSMLETAVISSGMQSPGTLRLRVALRKMKDTLKKARCGIEKLSRRIWAEGAEMGPESCVKRLVLPEGCVWNPAAALCRVPAVLAIAGLKTHELRPEMWVDRVIGDRPDRVIKFSSTAGEIVCELARGEIFDTVEQAVAAVGGAQHISAGLNGLDDVSAVAKDCYDRTMACPMRTLWPLNADCSLHALADRIRRNRRLVPEQPPDSCLGDLFAFVYERLETVN